MSEFKMAVKTMVAIIFAVVLYTLPSLANESLHLERPQAAESASYAFYVATVAYLFYCLFSTLVYPDYISPLRHIPRGKRWLARSLYYTHWLRRAPVEVLSQIDKETPNDGLIALREVTNVSLVVTKPATLAELLISRAIDFEKPAALQSYLKQLTLEGMLTVNGEKHKHLKKRSLSHFSFRAVKNLYPMMWRHALHFANGFGTDSEGGNNDKDITCKDTTEFAELSTEITIKIIGTTVFGRAYEAATDEVFARLRELVMFFLKPAPIVHIYMALAFYSPLWVSQKLAFPIYKAASATSAALEKLSLQLIHEKRESLRNGSQSADLATLMIQSGHFTDYEMASQLLTYMVAGQETTAATFNWICCQLGLDPGRQSALRDEIKTAKELFTDSEPDIDIAIKLEELPFLNGIINETLRLFPTVPLTQRVAIRDTTLGGYRVPAGTNIYFSPWLIHRSKEIWGPEADQFVPERWIKVENGVQKKDPSGGMRSNLDFTTFLHGPRSCIGQSFAKAELRCLTAALVSQYEWILCVEGTYIPMRGLVTLNPARGLPLRLTPLEKARRE